MSNPQITQIPSSNTGMLIRKPVADVFEAFIDPAITTRFWFTHSSGRLEPGKRVRWDWEMYQVSSDVEVLAIEAHKRILIEWSGYGTRTQVEWTFTPLAEGGTFVSITETGFSGDGDELVKHVAASTSGFGWVLAGLKSVLEHDINLHLIGDRFPKEIAKS